MSHAAVIERLRRRLGLDPQSIGEITLNHAIDEACVALECADSRALLARIDASDSDWQRFVDCMVVPETWLFRSPEQFDDLTRFIRERLPGRRPLRILSLPCATGEEAYSIAATLLASGLTPGAFEILGIDVSQRAIAAARAARYRASAARWRALDPTWFERDGECWVPTSAVTRSVHFRCGNLLNPDCFQPGERFDVVFFRNLLIYLDGDARRAAVARILDVLDDPGLVLSGQAESLATIDARLQPIGGFGPLSFGLAARGSVAAAQNPDPRPDVAERRRRTPATAPATRKPATQRAAATEPEPAALIERAREAADAGDFDTARALCDRLLAATPESAPAWLLHGLIAMASNQLEDAEQAFVRASYLDRNDAEALQYRAALAERQGRRREAAQLRSRMARMASGGGQP